MREAARTGLRVAQSGGSTVRIYVTVTLDPGEDENAFRIVAALKELGYSLSEKPDGNGKRWLTLQGEVEEGDLASIACMIST